MSTQAVGLFALNITPDNLTKIRSDRLTAYALSSSLCRMIPRVLCDLGSGFNTGSRLTWARIRVWHVIRRAEIAVAIIMISITVRASTTAILLTEHLVYIYIRGVPAASSFSRILHISWERIYQQHPTALQVITNNRAGRQQRCLVCTMVLL